MKVFDLKFSPHVENCLVSCGVKQITFWKLIGNTLQKKKGIFGQIKNITTMFCLEFSSTDKQVIYAGTLNGQIYIWKGTELKEILPGVHSSSIFQISKLNDGFATAGKDGKIRTWNESFNPIETIDLKMQMSHIDSPDYFFSNGNIYSFKHFQSTFN